MHRLKRMTHISVAIWILLMMTYSNPAKVIAQESIAQAVVIEVKNTTETDDYLCWSPVSARIKVVVPVANPVTVNLSSTSQGDGGAVWFQPDNSIRPTSATFSPTSQLSLTLPGDGTWVNFWVAGNKPSKGNKDVSIFASDETGGELGSLPLMVRVRKNADTLSPLEVDQFLSALATVHDLPNGALSSEYYKHARSHAEAFNMGIHGGAAGQPLFLAWHRAFLLNLERQLQLVDPRVTLPYWRFDQPSTNIFTPTFMGAVLGTASVPGGFLVDFSPTNPLDGWRMNDVNGGLVRRFDGTLGTSIPEGRLTAIFSNTFNAQYRSINGNLEDLYHNGPHCDIGGWLCSAASPRDPLFYLLHANVDRAWAHWQAQFNRFDPTDSSAYSEQGSFDNASGLFLLRKGSYVQDAMWPWTSSGGDQGTVEPMDDWPALSYPMPTVPGAEGPQLPPRPYDMIDYLDIAGQGVAHGACYDDVDFNGRPINVDNKEN